MDAESLPEFFDKNFLALSVAAILLVAMCSAWAAVLARAVRRQPEVEDALQVVQRQLHLTMDEGGMAPFVFDLRTGRLGEAAALQRLLGIDAVGRSDWVGETGIELRRVHRDDRRAWIAAWRDCAESGHLDHRLRYVCPDGAVVDLAVRADVEFAEDGEPRRLIGVCRDLTSILRLEQELADHRNQIAHLARVSHLGEMTAAIGHELRQPLLAIQFGAQTAQTYLATFPLARAKVAELLTDVMRYGQQAEAIIHRVHALTRREPVPFQVLRVNDLVRETLRDLQYSPIVSQTTVTLRLGENLPPVLGDHVRLRQLLANLVMNAAEAMAAQPRERRVLTIATSAESAGEVVLAVADCGPGLDPAIYEKLFLPFNTSKPEGLGLGLSICRGIAAAHFGAMAATNNKGAPGARFAVTLPAANPDWNAESCTDDHTSDHLPH